MQVYRHLLAFSALTLLCTALTAAPAVEITVGPGDTLTNIARRHKLEGATLKQTMDAIHRSNPDAFFNGDINRLKRGARLVIPASATPPQKAVQKTAPTPPPATEAMPDTPRNAENTQIIATIEQLRKLGAGNCAAKTKEVLQFLAGDRFSGAIVSSAENQPELRLISLGITTDLPGEMIYLNISPDPDCTMSYEHVRAWPADCASVAAATFAAYIPKLEASNGTVYAELNPSLGVFSSSLGDNGCLTVQKEYLP